ncbi:FISUMP domain-containing protein [Elizabethkingia meningoseptica]|uniref:FISUMP domain-containing protein n=1 Tax=Elizabethkingia meningoseptica TaxID=238 RepID=UPI0021A53E93|nr:FISUMP domain-containing protein [Elizabethkingia meningoseptica]
MLLFTIVSCRNSNAENEWSGTGKAVVKIQMSGVEFDNGRKQNHKTYSGNNRLLSNGNIQLQTIPVNKDIMLVAELIPSENSSEKEKFASLNGKVTGNKLSQLEALPQDIWYKVVVYNSASGGYIDEKDYRRGSENEGFILDGGVNYTFIAYSVNTKNQNELPKISFSDLNNKTLENSILEDMVGTVDFMYFKQEMIPSGEDGVTNYLDIVLKHKRTYVTAILDASAIGFKISSVGNIRFENAHYQVSSINLSDGSSNYSGNPGKSPEKSFTFSDDRTKATASLLVNGNTQNASLVIPSLVINGLTKDIKVDGIEIIPGVKYTLNLKLTNNDGIIVYEEEDAVRIAGMIWMRRYLGADKTQDPDDLHQINRLRGDFYKRGTNIPFSWANPISVNDWKAVSVNTSASAWNLGGNGTPKKNPENDPCPSGYRVPVQEEFNKLVAATSVSRISGAGGAVLTSKSNTGAKITFTATGILQLSTQSAVVMQSINMGYSWVSDLGDRMFVPVFNITSTTIGMSNISPGFATNIRCIAE